MEYFLPHIYKHNAEIFQKTDRTTATKEHFNPNTSWFRLNERSHLAYSFTPPVLLAKETSKRPPTIRFLHPGRSTPLDAGGVREETENRLAPIPSDDPRRPVVDGLVLLAPPPIHVPIVQTRSPGERPAPAIRFVQFARCLA